MSFADDILNSDASKFEAPKPLPVGTYVLQIKDWKQDTIKNAEQTPLIRLECAVESPIGIDPELLHDLDLANRIIRYDFFLTEKAAYRLTEFAGKTLRLNVNRPLKAVLADFRGQRFQAQIGQRGDTKNPASGVLYNEIKSTAPIT